MSPRVSVIVPARNEAATIVPCVRSIVDQEVDGGLEVIVADGRSSDDTRALARSAGAKVVDNPRGIASTGLNAALASAKGEIIVRFDGHSEMPPGYIAACLRALHEETGAVGVGGWWRIEGRGPWGRAAGAVLASPFGVGNSRLRRAPRPGEGRVDVDGFAYGCWPADVLRTHGGWDARFVRNQDFELSYRMRRAGGRIVFDPRIWSIYRPRESLSAIARQYWDYGRFKALVIVSAPASTRPRHLVPIGLVATVPLAVAPTPLARPARWALVLYAGVVGAVAASSRGGWRAVPVLATIHGAWGAGVVFGLLGAARRRAVRRVAEPGVPPAVVPNRGSAGKHVP
jgi:glycosyltransferase involved in cell wall biosynthesis